jgi:RNA polymerase sigma-70 factor, ECF subfamily
LPDGDPATEHHFFVYFEKLLRIKVRARTLASDKVEDLKQDAFIRVTAAVRKEGGVRQPERFGAFVNSICNNVLLEYYRSLGKNQQMDDTHEEDKVLDLEGMMASKQCSERARKILSRLPAVFLEEKEKDTVCREIGVDRNHLRVLLHRAKHKFKAVYEKEQFGALPRVDRIREFTKQFAALKSSRESIWLTEGKSISCDSSVSLLERVHGGLQQGGGLGGCRHEAVTN